jgi:hypothetical protein
MKLIKIVAMRAPSQPPPSAGPKQYYSENQAEQGKKSDNGANPVEIAS